jgi:hypothetical protein
MKRKLAWTAVALGAAGLVAAAACMGSSGSGNLTILATTGDGGSADAGSDGGSGGGLNLGRGIVLSEVRLLLRRVVLETCGSPCAACAACSTDGGEVDERCDDCDECEDEGARVRAGPVLVDLKGADLAGGVRAVLDADVPMGTYSGVKLVFAQASRKMVMDHPELAAMKALHASIAIDGTIDGAAFEFTTPMHVQQARCGPFAVGPSTSALTLAVDASGWFVGDTGQRLDPRAASDRGEILANLRSSLRLKESGDGGEERDECTCPPAADGGTDGGNPDAGL